MSDFKLIDRFPSGIVTPPPSKSYAHRAIICAALAEGESVIKNISFSQDIKATLSCIEKFGAKYKVDGSSVHIHGGLNETDDIVLDCGESGSTLRFILPIAALYGCEDQSGRGISFIGRGKLLDRPILPYDRIFKNSCVKLTKDHDKINIKGKLKSGTYELPGDVSSQFVSGLLLALPLTADGGEIHITSPLESKGYVDMTIDAMKCFGIYVVNEDYRVFKVNGSQKYQPANFSVENDYSQAAYFLAASALGRKVGCAGLNENSLQGDKNILSILADMGAEIHNDDNGVVWVEAERLNAVTVNARDIPDLIPPVAVLCSLCEGVSRIENAGRLRIKESDRLHAIALELTELGANITEGSDYLEIIGEPFLKGGRVKSHNDHRIAMSMALAAIRCRGKVELSGAEVVAKSYPNFWDDFENGGSLE